MKFENKSVFLTKCHATEKQGENRELADPRKPGCDGQKFQCEFTEISWGEWNKTFRWTASEWKARARTFVQFNDFEV